jgi:hypothetical protein
MVPRGSLALATLGEEFRKKEARLKKLWSARATPSRPDPS